MFPLTVTKMWQMIPKCHRLKKKIKQKEVSTDVDTILKYLDSKKETKQKKELDHTDYLFLSYAETFKKFLPRTQTIIKMEMAQMFGRAELRDMDGETPPPSSPFSSSSSWHSTPNYPGNSSEGVNYTEHQNYTSGPTLGSRAHSTESVKGFYENFTGENIILLSGLIVYFTYLQNYLL